MATHTSTDELPDVTPQAERAYRVLSPDGTLIGEFDELWPAMEMMKCENQRTLWRGYVKLAVAIPAPRWGE